MAFGKVKVSVYHGFHFNQEPFFNSNKFELNDKISFVMRKIADFLVHVPVDLMLMFQGNNTETPLRGDTNISELTFGLNEIKLYFGLKRCRQSLQLLERKQTKDLKMLWRLTVRGFGISNQIITTTYTDRNMAEIYEHIGAITGLPADHLIMFSKDKEVFPYTRESVFDGQKDFRESMIMFVVAYFQENEKMDDICIQYGIKHLKSLKLKFLTKEEELNPREMESIQDIKNYVYKTHDIPLHQQSILFQHQEIENDSTKIFDLLMQKERLEGGVICFNVVINKKPFEIETAVYHLGFGSSMMTVVHVSYSDTIAEVKMKILENHYSWKLENIQNQLDDESSAVSSTGWESPSDFFQFGTYSNIYENFKTVEECGISPNVKYELREFVLIRIRQIRLDSTEKNIVEYTITKDYYHLQLDEVLKAFRKQYKVHRKELRLLPGQEGVSKDQFSRTRIETNVFVIDYMVIKRPQRKCVIM
uniref:Uncharacterized protein n=1 Tax=Clytia hemisphaerica TaxID=252671 RepID=A0A7M5WKH6_9CNID